jgi:hypothetical protein
MISGITPDKRRIFEDKIKYKFAARAITIWIIYGIYALIFAHQIKGILTFVLYFFIGIFIASFASIPTYLLDYGLHIAAAAITIVLREVGGYIFLIFKLISFVIQTFWICIVAKYFFRFDRQPMTQ